MSTTTTDNSGEAAAEANPAPGPGADAPGILQVLPALVTGGAERGAIDVALAAQEAGFRSYVASSGGPMVRELVRAGIEHFELPLDSKNLVTVYRNVGRIAELAERLNVDIIHARSRAPAWSALYAARRSDRAFMTTFHATYNYESPIKKFYNSIMVKGDRVIAISDFIRDHMIEHYNIDWARVRVIHRGIDLKIFDPQAVSAERVVKLATQWRLPDGVPVILMSGRLTRWKGQMLLLQALPEIADLEFRCLFVGADQGRTAYREELESAAKRLGMDGRVHIVGDCNDMAAAYKLADVVVSASTDPEGFGRVAVEGQALGRPVIAPAHGAAPEQIEHGVNGWLFEPGNPHSVAKVLREALSLDTEARDKLHEAAIANVRRRFTKEEMCRKTVEVYRELADRRRMG
ncbi:glycosyltransferase family 4 protein [Hwanghaeella sp.]|uniref:glycosyltransferase family 4 protein n=1 Tax=Hwanghaeella sp. TaxID=2605943 RepID=UPI003CCC3C38